METPKRCMVSSRPFSKVRFTKQYGFCTVAILVKPCLSAKCTNSLTPYGVSLDKPMARTLPALTNLSKACSCAKMGVTGLSFVGSKYTPPNAGTWRNGQWIWYRSITSVCKRFKLASQASKKSFSVTSALPLRIQSMPRDGPAILVAMTNCLRTSGRLANQLPMIFSVAL